MTHDQVESVFGSGKVHALLGSWPQVLEIRYGIIGDYGTGEDAWVGTSGQEEKEVG